MVGDGGIQPLPKKSKLEASDGTTMDAFPANLVGKILSLVARARCVAAASVTCRKWQEAARNYLLKLSFDDLDWPKLMEPRGETSESLWSARELIIVETVMRTTCLQELLICCRPAEEDDDKSKMHAGMVMACFLHVKHTLKSFTITSPLMPNVNLLERLASHASVLEHLKWHHAYIPTFSTSVNGFPSLVSLALGRFVKGLSPQDFMLIFSGFPKLEHLSLKDVCVNEAPPTMELNVCTLKSLKMKRVMANVRTMVVLWDNKLGRLCVYLDEMSVGHLHWERREGSESMQYLRLQYFRVAEFEVGECLGHLEFDEVNIPLLEIKGNLRHLLIEDSEISQLKMESLDALIELELSNYVDFEAAWDTYAQIVSRGGLKVRKLTMRGSLPDKGLVNVDEVCLAFPSLQTLSMDYPNFYIDESTKGEPPLFKQITHLVLNTVMLPEYCEPFSELFTGLVQRCPNLKSVVIMLDVAITAEPFEQYDFLGELTSLLLQIMHLHPHIHVTFDFSP